VSYSIESTLPAILSKKQEQEQEQQQQEGQE
jgi:hypothetical protein